MNLTDNYSEAFCKVRAALETLCNGAAASIDLWSGIAGTQIPGSTNTLQETICAASRYFRLRELISTKSWWDAVDSLAKVAGSALGDAAPQLSASSANVRLPICNCWRMRSKKTS